MVDQVFTSSNPLLSWLRQVEALDGTGAPATRRNRHRRGWANHCNQCARPRAVPAVAAIVDGRGRYLIPGLWDMHVHHIGGYAEGAKLLPRLLAYGVTGLRDMASPVDEILRVRRESANGTLLGPEIVAARPILQRPLPFTTPPHIRVVTDADATYAVDNLQAQGVDFIKIGDTLTRDAYFGIATESRRLGLPFAGHLPVSVSALEATKAGQQSMSILEALAFATC